MNKGEYVLATKYSDGDARDHWAIGFYDSQDKRDRHYIVDGNGNQLRHNGFRRVAKISAEKGKLLLDNVHWIESGRLSMWGYYYTMSVDKLNKFFGELNE